MRLLSSVSLLSIAATSVVCSFPWDDYEPPPGEPRGDAGRGGVSSVGGASAGMGGTMADGGGGAGGDAAGGAGGNPEPCGNTTLDIGEECDDGNRADGDGCSAMCRVECDDGFVDTASLHCYFVTPEATYTWRQAQTLCAARGAGWTMAAPSTTQELDFVLTSVEIEPKLAVPTRGIWIGGSDESVEGTYVWLNGEPWNNIGWTVDQPDDNAPGTGEDCLDLLRISGVDGINDRNCDRLDQHVLCERPPAGVN